MGIVKVTTEQGLHFAPFTWKSALGFSGFLLMCGLKLRKWRLAYVISIILIAIIAIIVQGAMGDLTLGPFGIKKSKSKRI